MVHFTGLKIDTFTMRVKPFKSPSAMIEAQMHADELKYHKQRIANVLPVISRSPRRPPHRTPRRTPRKTPRRIRQNPLQQPQQRRRRFSDDNPDPAFYISSTAAMIRDARNLVNGAHRNRSMELREVEALKKELLANERDPEKHAFRPRMHGPRISNPSDYRNYELDNDSDPLSRESSLSSEASLPKDQKRQANVLHEKGVASSSRLSASDSSMIDSLKIDRENREISLLEHLASELRRETALRRTSPRVNLLSVAERAKVRAYLRKKRKSEQRKALSGVKERKKSMQGASNEEYKKAVPSDKKYKSTVPSEESDSTTKMKKKPAAGGGAHDDDGDDFEDADASWLQ